MSKRTEDTADVFGSPVLAIFIAFLFLWVGVSQSNAGHPIDALFLLSLAIFAIPRVRARVWKWRDYRSRSVIWALRLLYLLFGAIAVFYAIGAGGGVVGLVMVFMILLFAIGLVFVMRLWRSVRNSAQTA